MKLPLNDIIWYNILVPVVIMKVMIPITAITAIVAVAVAVAIPPERMRRILFDYCL